MALKFKDFFSDKNIKLLKIILVIVVVFVLFSFLANNSQKKRDKAIADKTAEIEAKVLEEKEAAMKQGAKDIKEINTEEAEWKIVLFEGLYWDKGKNPIIFDESDNYFDTTKLKSVTIYTIYGKITIGFDSLDVIKVDNSEKKVVFKCSLPTITSNEIFDKKEERETVKQTSGGGLEFSYDSSDRYKRARELAEELLKDSDIFEAAKIKLEKELSRFVEKIYDGYQAEVEFGGNNG